MVNPLFQRFADLMANHKFFSGLNSGELAELASFAGARTFQRGQTHYNTVRPHSALGYRPPAPQTIVPHRADRPFAQKGLRADRRSPNGGEYLN